MVDPSDCIEAALVRIQYSAYVGERKRVRGLTVNQVLDSSNLSPHPMDFYAETGHE